MIILLFIFIVVIVVVVLFYPNFRASQLATKSFLEGRDPEFMGGSPPRATGPSPAAPPRG
jgi:heme/copper-type cytochrome/quinol oxidase subunit 2